MEILRILGNVEEKYDESWSSGTLKYQCSSISKSFDLIVVFQLSDVIFELIKTKHPNLVFIPMYDGVHKKDRLFWNRLKNVKIINFSSALHTTCLSHHLNSYHLQYFPEAFNFSPAEYENPKLFFWQRRSYPNWQTVSSILPPAQFERIHIHTALDPNQKTDITPTTSEKRIHNITTSEWFESKDDFVSKLKEFNLFFIPREREGIGFSFLDAMSLGLIPIGFDQPTFNEYVIDKINGFIVDKKQRLDLPPLQKVSENLEKNLRDGRINYEKQLPSLEKFLTAPMKDSLSYYSLARSFLLGKQ